MIIKISVNDRYMKKHAKSIGLEWNKELKELFYQRCFSEANVIINGRLEEILDIVISENY